MSASPKETLLASNKTFSTKLLDITTLAIAEIIKVKDLLGSLGIVLFSCSKNGFNPFFTPLFIKYIIILNTTKLIPIIVYLHLISVKNFSTY